MTGPAVSVIISSYNYGRYLGTAVDSALCQPWEPLEVIVVDDGSTDESAAIIRSYGDRVRAIFQPNGGQGNAWNVGFGASRGEIVIFLDSDDTLERDAIPQIVSAIDDEVVHVHWMLSEIDAEGRKTGRVLPIGEIGPPATQSELLTHGPGRLRTTSSSGNAWSRGYLRQVLPIPEADYRSCPDDYLTVLAPLFGRIAHMDQCLSSYRNHGQNTLTRLLLEEKFRLLALRRDYLLRWAAKLGLKANPDLWKHDPYRDWLDLVYEVGAALESLAGRDGTVILADEEQMRHEYGKSNAVPFTERNGSYNGLPRDDAHAILELERLRERGATHIIFPTSSLWLLDHYRKFGAHLRSRYRVAETNDSLLAFDLRLSTPVNRRAEAPSDERDAQPADRCSSATGVR